MHLCFECRKRFGVLNIWLFKKDEGEYLCAAGGVVMHSTFLVVHEEVHACLR